MDMHTEILHGSSDTVLVTGCAGFIGSNFVARCKEYYPDMTIVGVDNFITGRREALDPSIIFYKGSVADKEFLAGVFAAHRPHTVFHFAAIPMVPYCNEHPTETSINNIGGMVAVLECARDYSTARVIHSSSAAVYGDVASVPIREDAPLAPRSVYGMQKKVAEEYCALFSAQYGVDTVSLRYFNVFGRGQYGGSAYATVMSNWLEHLYSPDGHAPFLEGDGTQSRDFCHIDNIIEANLLAMCASQPLNGDVINIGSACATDLNTVKRMIEDHTYRVLSLERRPARQGDIKTSWADITRARTILGYESRVDFAQGLADTVRWHQSRTT